MVRNWFCLLSLAAAALGIAGCGSQPAKVPPQEAGHHDHPSVGPHKGHLIEFGNNEEYHGELTHDDATKTITIYLLGPDAKTAVTSTDKEIEAWRAWA
jgi:hypothetical protein